MGIFRQFPYSNFHDMNMDEIIKICKELQDAWLETKAEWASYKDFIDNYFTNLNLDEETEKALRRLLAAGALDPIIDPVIASETAAWLAEHITPTTPVIDNTLSVIGAAADAKAAGFNINAIWDMLGTDKQYIEILPAVLNAGAFDAAHNSYDTGNPIYYHLDYTLQGEKYLIVSGYSYNKDFALWAFVDSDDNVISYGRPDGEKTGAYFYDQFITVPFNAVKVIVNEYITSSHYEYVYGIKALAKKLSENEFSVLTTCGTNYETSNVVPTKAYRIDGTFAEASSYCYLEANVTPGQTYLLNGVHYSPDYPLYILYDNNNNIITYPRMTAGGKKYIMIKVPSNAAKIIINGSRSRTNPSYTCGYPALRTFNSSNTLYDLVNGKQKKRYLFLGDSYNQGYSHDGDNDGWGAYLAEYMGLSSDEYVIAYNGGSSFASVNNFKTYIPLYPYDYFTDIIICGGYNDNPFTEAEILTGMQNLKTEANILYPYAEIHVGFIAWNKQGTGTGAEPNWQQIHQKLLDTVLPAYHKCTTVGLSYLNNVEYWINDTGMTNNDGYHPSEAGNRSLARAIANAIYTGSAPLPYNGDLRV